MKLCLGLLTLELFSITFFPLFLFFPFLLFSIILLNSILFSSLFTSFYVFCPLSSNSLSPSFPLFPFLPIFQVQCPTGQPLYPTSSLSRSSLAFRTYPKRRVRQLRIQSPADSLQLRGRPSAERKNEIGFDNEVEVDLDNDMETNDNIIAIEGRKYDSKITSTSTTALSSYDGSCGNETISENCRYNMLKFRPSTLGDIWHKYSHTVDAFQSSLQIPSGSRVHIDLNVLNECAVSALQPKKALETVGNKQGKLFSFLLLTLPLFLILLLLLLLLLLHHRFHYHHYILVIINTFLQIFSFHCKCFFVLSAPYVFLSHMHLWPKVVPQSHIGPFKSVNLDIFQHFTLIILLNILASFQSLCHIQYLSFLFN